MSAAPAAPTHLGFPLRFALLTSLVLILVFCGFGIVWVLIGEQRAETQRLQVIADLQARQVADWLRERQGDAELVRASPSLPEEYQRWRTGGDPQAAAHMQARLAPLLMPGGFRSIGLYAADGQLVWSTAGSAQDTAPELTAGLREALRTNQVQRVGPYLDVGHGPHLDYVVPLAAHGGPSALVVLHADPEDWLYPTLHTWPSPTATGESFLFRRDGERVLYLNSLRHRPDSAIRLRLPLASEDLLAARRLRGAARDDQAMHGVDYRGVPVLGVTQAIPGTDWFVGVKLDLEEIYVRRRPEIALILVTGLLAALIIGGAALMVRHRQQLALATATYQAQAEQLAMLGRLRASEQRFLATFEQAAVGIALIAPDGRWLRVNRRLCDILGYEEAELLDQTFQDLTHPADRDADLDAMHRLLAGETTSYALEKRYLRKGGGDVWINLTVSLVRGEAGEPDYFIAVVEDIAQRKLAESRLALWSTAFEKAELNLAIGDAVRQRLLAVNPAFAKRRGYHPEDMVGMPVAALFPADRLDEFLARLREADAKGHRVFETEHQCRDGARFPVLLDMTVTHSADGRSATRIVYALDISERKRIERDLSESRRRFQDIVDASADWVWEVDAQWHYTYVSESVQTLLGYDAAEILGKTPFDLMPAEEAARVAAEFAGIAARRAPFRDLEKLNRHKDGRLLYIYTNGMPILDARGELLGYRGLDRDVTEKRQAELALRESRELFRTLFNSLPDLVWLKDPNGVFLTCNARFETLLGAPEAEIVGKTDYDFVDRALADFFRAKDLAAIAAGCPQLNDEELTFASDGHRELVQVIKTPIYDARGQVIGVLGIARDITQLKGAEAELERHRHHLEDLVVERTADLKAARAEAERLARAKGEFLANMSHEIRTPMNAMLGLAYLLERQDLPAEARELARKIGQSGRGLLGIINDILDFSKIESGRVEIERVPFQLGEVLDGLATMMTATAAGKAIELVIRPPDCLDCTLRGDPLRLGQILINLTSNAIKFTPAGTVEVRIDRIAQTASDIRLRFSVRDTGIGIDPQTQARLFQPFMQADASTTRRFGGSGLGLVISRRLVDLMGGRVGLESSLGEGSTFWLELTFEVLEDHQANLGQAFPMQVLIADDNAIVREVAVATAKVLGWSAAQAESGGQALRKVLDEPGLQGPGAAVLLDWQMPGLDGLATAKAIREALPADAVPLLFLFTAHPIDAVHKMPGVEAVNGVLAKPLVSSALHTAVLAERRRRLGGAAPAGSAATSERHLSGIRILVVDDSDINREVAARIFAGEGAEVQLMGDGRAAVDWLVAAPHAVDIVLMDVHMPVMDGYTATRLIRRTPEIARLPVVALTADAQQNREAAALGAGMSAFLSKPFEVPEAVALIRHLTGHDTDRAQGQAPVVDHRGPPGTVSPNGHVSDCDRYADGHPDQGLPGIALERGLALWSNGGAYRRYLRRFAHAYADSAAVIATAEPAAAHQLAHKLKGTAGNLGLMEVATRAAALEQHLAQGANAATAETNTVVAALQEALDTALDSIARYAPEASTALAEQPQEPVAGIGSAQARAQLAPLLQQAFAACERFDPMAAGPALEALSTHLPAARLAPLRQAIDLFDAPGGAALVRALANELNIRLEEH